MARETVWWCIGHRFRQKENKPDKVKKKVHGELLDSREHHILYSCRHVWISFGNTINLPKVEMLSISNTSSFKLNSSASRFQLQIPLFPICDTEKQPMKAHDLAWGKTFSIIAYHVKHGCMGSSWVIAFPELLSLLSGHNKNLITNWKQFEQQFYEKEAETFQASI